MCFPGLALGVGPCVGCRPSRERGRRHADSRAPHRPRLSARPRPRCFSPRLQTLAGAARPGPRRPPVPCARRATAAQQPAAPSSPGCRRQPAGPRRSGGRVGRRTAAGRGRQLPPRARTAAALQTASARGRTLQSCSHNSNCNSESW